MKKSTVVAGICSAVLLFGAASAGAQITGLYYQAVEMDGHVYVFNTYDAYRSWQQSGEMGKSITLVGRALDGKTLVGENETAIDLYLFKHDLPAYDREAPTPDAPAFDVSWKDGKTTFQTKSAKITLSNRVQARYTYFDTADPATEDVGTFNIRRAKTAIEGDTGDWKFKLQANWVGQTDVVSVSTNPDGTVRSVSTRRSPELEDAEIWWKKNPMATVWVGQGKVPFGRQEYTSSGKQQFVDRWIGNDLYTPGRDQGIRIEGENAAKTFEYAFGVYNGTARNTNLNDNDEYLISARAVWTPFGEYKLEEGAHDYPDSPKLALGAAILDNTLGAGASAIDVERLGFEAAFKWLGFSAQAEYFDETATQAGVDSDNEGYYLQAGYLFPSRKLELAARIESVEREQAFRVSNLGSALKDLEGAGFAVNYYLNRHVDKLQADYFVYEDKTTGRELEELRVQLQIIF